MLYFPLNTVVFFICGGLWGEAQSKEDTLWGHQRSEAGSIRGDGAPTTGGIAPPWPAKAFFY